MKVNAAVLSLKGLSVSDKSLLTAFFSVLSGLMSGSLVYAFDIFNNDNPIGEIFISFNTDFIGKTDIEVFSGITVSVLIYFMILFISGSSIFGRTMCIVTTLLKFAGIGALISHLYSSYGLKGLEYVLLIFFPGKLFLIFAAVLMTKCSFDMSNTVKNGSGEKGSTASVMKLYYLKSLVFLSVFILSAAVDFFTIKIFSGLFDFSLL